MELKMTKFTCFYYHFQISINWYGFTEHVIRIDLIDSNFINSQNNSKWVRKSLSMWKVIQEAWYLVVYIKYQCKNIEMWKISGKIIDC